MIVPLPPHVVAALRDTAAASTTHVLLPAHRVGDAVVMLPKNRVEEPMLVYLANGARVPEYKTDGAAGMDLHALLPGPMMLAPGARGVAMKAFVCAAWAHAHDVRELHRALRSQGVECLSKWADDACDGPEALERFSREQLLDWRDSNYEGITRADVVIFLADTPAREAFVEVTHAILWGKRVVWCGRDTLSTACEVWPNVERVSGVGEAIEAVVASRVSRVVA